MKLNLGCGADVKQGYTNVDFRDLPGVQKVDLSKFPWPFSDESAEEIIMLDFLEHFPYKKTETILQEAWRVLKMNGRLDVQVPDLLHCSRAATLDGDFQCNKCGEFFSEGYDHDVQGNCKCGQSMTDLALAATHRLMGGQDYEGNFHYAVFSETLLTRLLKRNGFSGIVSLERNENGETFFQNWNIKLRAVKDELSW